MCGKGSSGGGGYGGFGNLAPMQQNTVQASPEAIGWYQQAMGKAQQAAAQPWQNYSTDPNAFVAPLTQTQQAGIQGIAGAQGSLSTILWRRRINDRWGRCNNYTSSAQPIYEPLYAASNVASSGGVAAAAGPAACPTASRIYQGGGFWRRARWFTAPSFARPTTAKNGRSS